jgi:hypothetical protein
MRRIVTISAVFIASSAPVANAVDYPLMLDQPGVLEAIQKNDPARHEKLVGVLAAAQEAGCAADLAKLLEARFGVTSAKCTGYALATEPPKARFIFTLGDNRYSTILIPSSGVNRRNAD